ncbi:MAG: hypothetical protein JO129_01415 [Candidatus Dependentiae bacterium]|nr:hypothetical protein [Candidatus Dependentiae bacterium]
MFLYFIVLLISFMSIDITASNCCSSCLQFLMRENIAQTHPHNPIENISQAHPYKSIIVHAVISKNQSINDQTIPTAYPVDNSQTPIAKPEINQSSIERIQNSRRPIISSYNQYGSFNIFMPFETNLDTRSQIDAPCLMNLMEWNLR